MPQPDGYRVDRLRRRRRTRAERVQLVVLYVLAAAVAFGAVLGAWSLAKHLLGGHEKTVQSGYIVLLVVQPAQGGDVSALLAVKDATTGDMSLFVVPRELLLTGPQGEYVMTGDSIAAGTVKGDLQRVIDAKVDAVYRLPSDALVRLSAAERLRLRLDRAVTLTVDGVERGYKTGAEVPASLLPGLLSAAGPTGYDAATMEASAWQAGLAAAAVRPAAERKRAAGQIAAASQGADRELLQRVLTDLAAASPEVERIPSSSRVAEGQFAFVPESDQIQAEITRRSSTYHAKYTVIVRNGSGAIGVADDAIERLGVLDVNLPAAANADRFGYKRTEIQAGRNAVGVAQDVRAILGRGVILDGASLPATTVVVIIGADYKPSDRNQKDEQ